MENIKTELQNDSVLLLQIQEGSKIAFNILYEKYWEQTFSNAYKRLKDEDQAKDIVQEIFVSIWLKKENQIGNLSAYLNCAVRNQVFKLAAKNKNISPFLYLLENIPTTNCNADGNILWQEFYQSYEVLIKALPPKRQQIFRLRFHDDITTKAIANEMGISRKTVQNQLGKAIEQLRVILLHSILLFYFFFIS